MTSILKLYHRLHMYHSCKVGIRIYFLNAFDFHLPMCWIWSSEKPRAAAVVAAPILKLWVWSWWRLRLQKDRASLSWSVKNCLDTGTPSMKENSGWDGESCFLILRYCIRDLFRQRFESVLFCWSRIVEVEDFACLKCGMVISIYSPYCASDFIVTFPNKMKCCIEPEVLVISPIRKKAQNATRNIALKRHLVKYEAVVCSKTRRRDFRILGVIGSLESDDGFTFWNPCNIFLIIKCCVMSTKFSSWKMKLKADIKVCTVEAADPLR